MLTIREEIELRRRRDALGALRVGVAFALVAAVLFAVLHHACGSRSSLVLAGFELFVALLFVALARRVGRRVRELEDLDR